MVAWWCVGIVVVVGRVVASPDEFPDEVVVRAETWKLTGTLKLPPPPAYGTRSEEDEEEELNSELFGHAKVMIRQENGKLHSFNLKFNGKPADDVDQDDAQHRQAEEHERVKR